VKTQKSKLQVTVALVLAAVLLITGASISVLTRGEKNPLIDQSYGVELQAKDSSAANVEINEIVQSTEIPASPALDILKEELALEEAAALMGEAPGLQLQAAVPEKTAEESAAEKATFDGKLETFLAGGQQEKFEVFLERKYENPTIVSILDFAEFLMGPANPIKSIVDICSYLLSGVHDPKVALEPVKSGKAAGVGSSVSELFIYFTDNEGTLYTLSTGVYYDALNMLLYGKDEKGLFAFGYDADVKNLMLYTTLDSWQRNFGFALLYDIASPLINFHYVTVRVLFSYGDYDWMVQIWKGRYTVGSGCEIGLYYKDPTSKIEFFNTAEDKMLIPMSMELYLNGNLIMERSHDAHWWLAGFVLPPVLDPHALTMKGTMTFKATEMAKRFAEAAEDTPCMSNILFLNKNTEGLTDIKIAANGKKVSFTW